MIETWARPAVKPRGGTWERPGSLYQTLHHKQLMLYTLALILVIAWLLGLVSSYTLGGFIHILLVVALVLIVVRLIQGNRPV